ncbi:MAG: penicillin-binding protein 2 [Bacteroidetes bacterium]|nr:penicillin-binding protein 2 [Bacteroidota bacterium]MBT5531273.1 penicillin-binding protein 2 [Cytophagia bacterium]MBT3421756.1 penicillin-binding protein 2 [Bacteroidota bacterium]MBT3801240.1 penicillin-binding protein 2 [Bacteroidota bacterium]MBT4337508.1 penicillin-binding protein 2 [Bacteroidota bacterium]
MNVHKSRHRVIIFFIVFVGVVFFSRLIILQVFTEKYKQFAENNVLSRKIIKPPRGLIYDRNGKILVSNEAIYDLMIVPAQLKLDDETELCRILEITKKDYQERLVKAKQFYHKPTVFISNIPLKTYGVLQERFYEFKGFFVQPQSIRKYPHNTAAHVLGYIGEVNREDIDASENYYKQGHNIGKSGLEKVYEKDLRGVYGEKYVLMDVYNTEQGSYLNGELDRPAVIGKNLISSLNLELQLYAELLLKGKKGSVVAIEPETGEILAIVSSPAYDPSMLYGRERSANYNSLVSDPDKPLFNRAITAMYPPGSTFKVAMALIGLKEGVISPSTAYGCPGGYIIGNLRIGCHNHSSPLNLQQSLTQSCNAYYCHVFRNVIDLNKFATIYEGYDNWKTDVLEFGMGKKLGIDLFNEAKGILPSTKRYDNIYGENRWKSTNILSLAIGQAEISLTPLQLANFSAAVANRGYYYTPHIVKTYVDNGKYYRKIYDKHLIDIDSANYKTIIDAMADVPNIGTAIRYGPYFKEYQICGKTGTAQNPHGDDHSVFISFAPKNNPKIAIAVVIENAGQGAHWAAPICFLVTEHYLSQGKQNEKTKWIQDIMVKGVYHPIIIKNKDLDEEDIEEIINGDIETETTITETNKDAGE